MRRFKIQMGDMGPPPPHSPPAQGLSQGLQKTGMIMLAEIQDLMLVQMIIYHWVVMSVDLVFFIFSHQYYIGIMNSYKKKACISCVYNYNDLPSNNSSLHSSHMIFIYS